MGQHREYFAEITDLRTHLVLPASLADHVLAAFESGANAETYVRDHTYLHPFTGPENRVRVICVGLTVIGASKPTVARYLVVCGSISKADVEAYEFWPDAIAAADPVPALVVLEVPLFCVDQIPVPPRAEVERMESARLTSDVVLFAGPEQDRHVLLIQRGWAPFEGAWALPGGHVDPGETFAAAAHRELTEETGLDAADLFEVGTYSTPGRDPRGRYVTTAFTATLATLPEPTPGDDARAARWVPLAEVAGLTLAFDHGRILADALNLIGRSA